MRRSRLYTYILYFTAACFQEIGLDLPKSVLGHPNLTKAPSSQKVKFCRDQRLYKQVLSPKVEDPQPLTAADSKLRFADGIIDEARKSIITVQEDHSGSGEAVNTIAIIGLAFTLLLLCKVILYRAPADEKAVH